MSTRWMTNGWHIGVRCVVCALGCWAGLVVVLATATVGSSVVGARIHGLSATQEANPFECERINQSTTDDIVNIPFI